MKKAATWAAVLAGVIAAIDILAFGIGVYRMDEDLIRITACMILPCLVISFIAAFVLHFGPSRCSHCSRYIPTNAVRCPFCGEEIHREVK